MKDYDEGILSVLQAQDSIRFGKNYFRLSPLNLFPHPAYTSIASKFCYSRVTSNFSIVFIGIDFAFALLLPYSILRLSEKYGFIDTITSALATLREEAV